MNSAYQEAKQKFLSGDYSVAGFFKQNDFLLEYAYCKLLSDELTEAEIAFTKISNKDFRADWGIKLITFIQNKVTILPSYFQIRNFLEIDINLLIQSGQAQFVENIINQADLLSSINPESYKFIARAMLNNDFTDIAMHYLKKARDVFFHDPEMHFMLAICHIRLNDITEAKESLKACLTILPGYFPAKMLLSEFS